MRIKRYHEAPKSIFKEVQKITDGDYALVHLFEDDQEYYNLFKQAVSSGRDVILDNSLFELREAFDGDKYVKWIKDLQPTWFIVPDSWKDSEGTARKFFKFREDYPDLFREDRTSKIIGVAQGMGLSDTIECYEAIEPYCDMVAFNLQGEQWWEDSTGKASEGYITSMSRGRFNLIYAMNDLGVINRDKPHHLLGTGLAAEASWYVAANLDFIRSIDTSSPVACGMVKHKYSSAMGNTIKPDFKMCDAMDARVSDSTFELIKYNIEIFDSFCGGSL